jgi:uncharacterized protein YmfQ (DUF2313 family)
MEKDEELDKFKEQIHTDTEFLFESLHKVLSDYLKSDEHALKNPRHKTSAIAATLTDLFEKALEMYSDKTIEGVLDRIKINVKQRKHINE